MAAEPALMAAEGRGRSWAAEQSTAHPGLRKSCIPAAAALLTTTRLLRVFALLPACSRKGVPRQAEAAEAAEA